MSSYWSPQQLMISAGQTWRELTPERKAMYNDMEVVVRDKARFREQLAVFHAKKTGTTKPPNPYGLFIQDFWKEASILC